MTKNQLNITNTILTVLLVTMLFTFLGCAPDKSVEHPECARMVQVIQKPTNPSDSPSVQNVCIEWR